MECTGTTIGEALEWLGTVTLILGVLYILNR